MNRDTKLVVIDQKYWIICVKKYSLYVLNFKLKTNPKTPKNIEGTRKVGKLSAVGFRPPKGNNKKKNVKINVDKIGRMDGMRKKKKINKIR